MLDFWNLETVMKDLDYEYLKMYHQYTTDENLVPIHPRIPASLKDDFLKILPRGKSMSVVICDILISYVLEKQREEAQNHINTSRQNGDNTQNNQNTYITNNYYGDSEQGKDTIE